MDPSYVCCSLVSWPCLPFTLTGTLEGCGPRSSLAVSETAEDPVSSSRLCPPCSELVRWCPICEGTACAGVTLTSWPLLLPNTEIVRGQKIMASCEVVTESKYTLSGTLKQREGSFSSNCEQLPLNFLLKSFSTKNHKRPLNHLLPLLSDHCCQVSLFSLEMYQCSKDCW